MMRRRRRVILELVSAVLLLGIASQPAKGQHAQSVLFVCEHGTVKSLLAKVLFDEYAAEIGLHMRAVSRGTRADSVVPDWMKQRLSNEHIALGDWRPQSLRGADLASAVHVVSFDVPAPATSAARGSREQWDGLPSVSKDFATGRDAIKAKVRALVDSLKRAERVKSPSSK